MCGLVGAVIARNKIWPKEIDAFMYQGLFISMLRGRSGTGVGAVNRAGDIMYEKSHLDAYAWMFTPQFSYVADKLLHQKVILGHTRAPTFQNTVHANNAQPFLYDAEDASKSVLMTHNGHINNYYNLVRDKKFSHPVDSAHIAKALADAADPVKVLEEMRGNFALVWYDNSTEKVYFASNGGRDIALAFSPEHDRLYYASEAYALQHLLERNKLAYKEIFELPEMKIIGYDFDGDTIKEEPPVPFRDPQQTQMVTATGGHASGTTIDRSLRGKTIWVNTRNFDNEPYHPYNASKKSRKAEFGWVIGDCWQYAQYKVKINGVQKEYWDNTLQKIRLTGIPVKVTHVSESYVEVNGNNVKCKLLDAVVSKEDVAIELGRLKSRERLVARISETEQHHPALPVAIGNPASERKDILGPEGSNISYREWREIANDGCLECGENILDTDINFVRFTVMQERMDNNVVKKIHMMICPPCTRKENIVGPHSKLN